MSRKFFWMYVMCFIFVASGCNLRNRELELDKRTAQLNEKEQQLNLKEQSLDFREQLLLQREIKLDSSSKKNAFDSLFLKFPQLQGAWNVKMECIETNCPGSAVGDTKNEQWNFTLLDNKIIVTATDNKKLVRVYAGDFSGDAILLHVQQDSSDVQAAKMNVKLQRVNEKEIEGTREIIQSGGCKIVYTLQLKKL